MHTDKAQEPEIAPDPIMNISCWHTVPEKGGSQAKFCYARLLFLLKCIFF